MGRKLFDVFTWVLVVVVFGTVAVAIIVDAAQNMERDREFKKQQAEHHRIMSKKIKEYNELREMQQKAQK